MKRSCIILAVDDYCGADKYIEMWSKKSETAVFPAYARQSIVCAKSITSFTNFEFNGGIVRNPDYPSNYIDYIKSLRSLNDVIFVKSDINTITVLNSEKIEFCVVTQTPKLLQSKIFKDMYKLSDEDIVRQIEHNDLISGFINPINCEVLALDADHPVITYSLINKVKSRMKNKIFERVTKLSNNKTKCVIICSYPGYAQVIMDNLECSAMYMKFDDTVDTKNKYINNVCSKYKEKCRLKENSYIIVDNFLDLMKKLSTWKVPMILVIPKDYPEYEKIVHTNNKYLMNNNEIFNIMKAFKSTNLAMMEFSSVSDITSTNISSSKIKLIDTINKLIY